jgi:hypothetical protein
MTCQGQLSVIAECQLTTNPRANYHLEIEGGESNEFPKIESVCVGAWVLCSRTMEGGKSLA